MISILILGMVLTVYGDQDALRVIVRDDSSQRPVAGAEIFTGEEYAGTTDATGSLILHASDSDLSRISVVRTGYHSADTTHSRESVLIITLRPDPEILPSIESAQTREPPGEWSLSVRRSEIRDNETIEDHLDDIPGVRVEESSGDIGIGSVSLRGSPAHHTAVWIDGIPVTDSKFGTMRTRGLLPGIIERLDVYQGWTPSRLGGTYLGGGIELHTAEHFREGVRLFGGYGSYGRFTGGAGAGFRRRGFRIWIDAQGIRQDNRFRFSDDNATPFNAEDDTIRVRSNGSVEAVNLLAKISADIGSSSKITVTSLGSWRREGIPGPGANPIADATHRSWDERIIIRVSRIVPSSVLRLTAYHEVYSSTVRDPSAELAHFSSRRKESGTSSGTRCYFRYDTHPFWAADGRFEVQYERFRSRIQTSMSTGEKESRGTMELGAGLEIRPGDRFRIRGEAARAVVCDYHEGEDSDKRFSRAIRASFEVQPITEIFLSGSVSNRSRAPTLSELYGNRGSVHGNDALVPEKGRQLELGVSILDKVTLSGYLREIDDLILYWLRSPRIIIPENIGRARTKGIEFSALHVFENSRMLTLRLSVINQRTEDRSRVPYYRGNDLPGTPRTIYGGTMDMNPGGDLHMGAGLRYESEFYIDRANKRREDSRFHTRIWLILGSVESSRLTVHVDDVFDDAGINQWGYPVPGRRFRAQITTRF